MRVWQCPYQVQSAGFALEPLLFLVSNSIEKINPPP